MKNVKLDSNQKKAVVDKHHNILVLAPPGSGKTTVIINRMIYLIKYCNVNTDNMAIITFTKAAAENMKQRFIKYCNAQDVKYGRYPFFGTFHSLFYRILRSQGENIKIISENESYYIIKTVVDKYSDLANEQLVKEILNSISMFKNNGVATEGIKLTIDKDMFYKCYKEYELYKQERRLLDFDDIQIRCRDLFFANGFILNKYRKMFKYILVDEFQDCDALQIKILQLLNRGNNLFAVGDEDQCIYGFRGSKPECMVKFDEYFMQGKKVFLIKNYRSGEKIVNISKKIIANNNLRNHKKIVNHNEFKSDINLIKSSDEREEIKLICESIQRHISKEDLTYNDVAILYRRNIESMGVIDACIKRKIPFRLLEKPFDLYNHFICKDIINYFKIATDNRDEKSFIQIINKPFRYIGKLLLKKLEKYKIKESCFDILYEQGISLVQFKILKSLEKKLNKLIKLPISKVMNFILKDIGYMEYINYYVEKFKLNKEDVMYIINTLENSLMDFQDLGEFLKYVSKSKKIENKENAITLSSIHRVKGMEFKEVFIINCSEGNIPYKKDGIISNLEEERRLFYVGITRAIKNLNICFSNTLGNKYVSPSRFIKEGEILNEDLYEFKVGDEVKHYYLGNGVVDSIRDCYITINFSNILRKFNIKSLTINKLISKFKDKCK